jgi:hypothetical protein
MCVLFDKHRAFLVRRLFFWCEEFYSWLFVTDKACWYFGSGSWSMVYCVSIFEKERYFFKQNLRVLLYSPSVLWGPLNFGCAAIVIKFCANILTYQHMYAYRNGLSNLHSSHTNNHILNSRACVKLCWIQNAYFIALHNLCPTHFFASIYI